MATQSTVARAFPLLQYLSRHPGEHGVRALASDLDLSPSTTYRLLATLAATGIVGQNRPTARHSIVVAAVQLGSAALGSQDLTARAVLFSGP
jgi:DNA-binding IclR family transcriptional regulator